MIKSKDRHLTGGENMIPFLLREVSRDRMHVGELAEVSRFERLFFRPHSTRDERVNDSKDELL